MSAPDKTPRRRYHAPVRAAAAAETRGRILIAAKKTFETRGWSGATIPLIAHHAAISHQTVEAVFGTKAALLQAVVDFAIRGDARETPMVRRDAIAAIEQAPDVATMLDLHAQLVRSVSERSARIAWVVEHAAPSEPRVAQLWKSMTQNRASGVRWAAHTLLQKPDADPNLDLEDVEETFWIALDWGTYRSLTAERGLGPDAFEAWLKRYYRRMIL